MKVFSDSKIIGNFQISTDAGGGPKQIGKGGLGVVYHATHFHTGESVALKVIREHLSDKPDIQAKFREESKSLRKLNHVGIVRVIDQGVEDGVYYCAMELCQGGNLGDYVNPQRHGKMDQWQMLRALRQILDALNYVHGYDRVHRDIKPANILLAQYNTDPSLVALKLGDFGLAKKFIKEDSPQLSKTGGFFGTKLYASPEQLKELSVDGRTDIFSVGMTAWHILLGHEPPVASDIFVDALIVQERLDFSISYETKLPSDLHPQVRKLLASMLQKDWDKRVSRCSILVDQIDDILEARQEETRKWGPQQTVSAGRSKGGASSPANSSAKPPLKEFFTCHGPIREEALSGIRVEKATDLRTKRFVKLLRLESTLDPVMRRQILESARRLGGHPHESIVPTRLFEARDEDVVVMDLSETGPRLVDQIRESAVARNRTLQDWIPWLIETASAIDHTAALRLVGLDTEPSSVVIVMATASPGRLLFSPRLHQPLEESAGFGGTLDRSTGGGATTATPKAAFAGIIYWMLAGRAVPETAINSIHAYQNISGIGESANQQLRDAFVDPKIAPGGCLAFLQAILQAEGIDYPVSAPPLPPALPPLEQPSTATPDPSSLLNAESFRRHSSSSTDSDLLTDLPSSSTSHRAPTYIPVVDGLNALQGVTAAGGNSVVVTALELARQSALEAQEFREARDRARKEVEEIRETLKERPTIDFEAVRREAEGRIRAEMEETMKITLSQMKEEAQVILRQQAVAVQEKMGQLRASEAEKAAKIEQIQVELNYREDLLKKVQQEHQQALLTKEQEVEQAIKSKVAEYAALHGTEEKSARKALSLREKALTEAEIKLREIQGKAGATAREKAELAEKLDLLHKEAENARKQFNKVQEEKADLEQKLRAKGAVEMAALRERQKTELQKEAEEKGKLTTSISTLEKDREKDRQAYQVALQSRDQELEALKKELAEVDPGRKKRKVVLWTSVAAAVAASGLALHFINRPVKEIVKVEEVVVVEKKATRELTLDCTGLKPEEIKQIRLEGSGADHTTRGSNLVWEWEYEESKAAEQLGNKVADLILKVPGYEDVKVSGLQAASQTLAVKDFSKLPNLRLEFPNYETAEFRWVELESVADGSVKAEFEANAPHISRHLEPGRYRVFFRKKQGDKQARIPLINTKGPINENAEWCGALSEYDYTLLTIQGSGDQTNIIQKLPFQKPPELLVKHTYTLTVAPEQFTTKKLTPTVTIDEKPNQIPISNFIYLRWPEAPVPRGPSADDFVLGANFDYAVVIPSSMYLFSRLMGAQSDELARDLNNTSNDHSSIKLKFWKNMRIVTLFQDQEFDLIYGGADLSLQMLTEGADWKIQLVYTSESLGLLNKSPIEVWPKWEEMFRNQRTLVQSHYVTKAPQKELPEVGWLSDVSRWIYNGMSKNNCNANVNKAETIMVGEFSYLPNRTTTSSDGSKHAVNSAATPTASEKSVVAEYWMLQRKRKAEAAGEIGHIHTRLFDCIKHSSTITSLP